VRPARANTG